MVYVEGVRVVVDFAARDSPPSRDLIKSGHRTNRDSNRVMRDVADNFVDLFDRKCDRWRAPDDALRSLGADADRQGISGCAIAAATIIRRGMVLENGGSNIQFAVNPKDRRARVEMNPLLSR